MNPQAKVPHKWTFRTQFRRGGFGWRSQPAIVRVRQAVGEIKKVARKDPMLAAEGAVLFIERVSPALERIDSSSGAMGAAVNRAVDELAAIVGGAPADAATRDRWLERIWAAYLEDDMGYLGSLEEAWGELCGAPETASAWADLLVDAVRDSWRPGHSGYLRGTIVCLSALFKAERYMELIELVEHARYITWSYREWGFRALVALGRRAEALRYAEASRDRNENGAAISRACEEMLLASGFAEEAYRRYGLDATFRATNLATFQALAKKYPSKAPAELLRDLVASTPGSEGKWFAAAKAAGLYDEAIYVAGLSPCDPKTLARAARDFDEERPAFAMEASLLALRWIGEGWGYEITSLDVTDAYASGKRAAEQLDRVADFVARTTAIVSNGIPFLRECLKRALAAEAVQDQAPSSR
jgi:hypothetical protein